MAAKVPKLLHKMSVTAQKSWYERNKVPLPSHLTTGSVAKASKEVKPSERVKKMQTVSLKAYGATKGTRMGSDDGSGEAIRDTIAPLTRDQHSKVQAAKRAAKSKEVLDTKSKRLAFLKKLSTKPAVKAPEPEDFDHEGHDDNIDVHRQLHVSGAGSKYSMDESTMNETTKKEAEKILGGEVKEKPKMGPGKQPAGYRYVRGLARKAMKAGIKKEEVEVTEAVKDAADVGEYDYEGDMAKSQLRSILANAKRLHDMLEDQTNLPEWVQSKITLAEDYILTAANYMEGEINEAAKDWQKAFKKVANKNLYKDTTAVRTSVSRLEKTVPEKDDDEEEVKHAVKKMVSGVKEESEQVDEKINLVKAKMGDVIKDFQKSDAPQFKGKSQEKRRKMALAAKLSAEREAGMREEVVAEAEGKVAVTPKEKDLAAHHGDPKKITYGDVIKARLKSVAAKKLGK